VKKFFFPIKQQPRFGRDATIITQFLDFIYSFSIPSFFFLTDLETQLNLSSFTGLTQESENCWAKQ
jgi:hypothetical protein